MKIDITSIDAERFHVNRRTLQGVGDVLLIVPHKAMWEWKSDELHLRSLLCSLDGTVLSAGFPKFFNYGEDKERDRELIETFMKGDVSLPEKLDGSLIIRTVIGDVVNIRTRGCELVASDMREDVEKLIKDEYAYLLDPEFEPHGSLLMEYVAPKNQIVVRYDYAKLYLLGLVDFSGDELLVKPAPDIQGMKRPRTFLAPKSIEQLADDVKAFEGKEGVVVWAHTDKGMMLTKMKSSWYMRLHSLRSQATPRYVREYCCLNKIMTLDALKAALFKEGFDWEVVSFMQESFLHFIADVDAAEAKLLLADDIVAMRKETLTERKDLAIQLKKDAEYHSMPDLFPYMIASAVGDGKANEIAEAYRFDMTVTQLRMLKRVGIRREADESED